MNTTYLVEEYFDDLVGNGFEVNIKPCELENDWLGVSLVGFEVSISKDDVFITKSVHRFLSEALSDACDFLIAPAGKEAS